MPRDSDKNNDSRRRDRPSGGKGRSGAARGPEKKFAKRGFAGKGDGDKRDGERRPYAGKSDGAKSFGKKPYASGGKPYAGKRDGDDRPPRRDFGDAPRPRGDRPFAGRPSRGGDDEKRSFKPREDRGGEKRPYTPRGDRPNRGRDRGDSKPWQKREDRGERDSRPSRDGARNFDKPRFDRPRDDRGGDERPRFSRSREDRPKFDRPRERQAGRTDWQEHPRSEAGDDRPRRENEDDSKIFAKRPAFGGRGAYRERQPEFDKRAPQPPRVKKSGERIAKVVSRAGLASRRDAEEWITQGRVTVNGRVINSPALDVTGNDTIAVDGKPLPPRERTRLFMFHKPRGLMTTHADPEGRPTVFDNLPEGLPRLISIGRLDFNTEGLLLLTNDGGLARALELADTGWLRRYRVRAHGEVTQAQLDELKKGVEDDGVKYGSIDAVLERDQGANVWLVFAIREGKNREVRNVMAHLGPEG